MGWINVEDRLPEDSGAVLTIQYDGWIQVARLIPYLAPDDMRCWFSGVRTRKGFAFDSTVVTHWMPLPAPPEVTDGLV